MPLRSFRPLPVLASVIKLSHPQPFLRVQNRTNISEPKGKRILETRKSSKSIIFVFLPKGVTPERMLKPRTQGIERTNSKTSRRGRMA